ncbi:hypothetical protein [Algicola sagamiensis]|uniref:hypothetical protein n=1 Tax=Algicola sagamiensis TaxID=163869 RepID=UPI00037C52C7|nr:hypothetical protein [Algicola sagamiensis]
MKELQDVVTNKMNEMIADGTLECMLRKALEKTVQEVVDKSMRSYGEFGKALGSLVNKTMALSLEQVSLPEYNNFLADCVNETLNEILETEGKQQVLRLLSEKMGAAPEAIHIHEVFKEITTRWRSDAESEQESEITLEWRRGTCDFTYLTLKHPGCDFEDIHLSLDRAAHSNSYYIYSVRENTTAATDKAANSSDLYTLTQYFYKLYCRKTMITGIDDAYGEDLYIWDYE